MPARQRRSARKRPVPSESRRAPAEPAGVVPDDAPAATSWELGERWFWLGLLAILLLTVAAYAQVGWFDFVRYDDPKYVTDNAHVRAGLTAAGVQWAFTTGHASNWHPLTWLSHMLDVQLLGLRSGAHHLVNVLLHLVNTVLLAVALTRLTGRRGVALAVAGLFALHPLHVESVAWVAERKDVLSTCLGLLCLLSYVAYVRRGGAWRYALVAATLALGLMAKPMLVTWPALLLLLDYWPLGRLRAGRFTPTPAEPWRGRTAMKVATGWQPAVLEKLPLLGLAIASAIVTYLVQQAGEAMVEGAVPIHLRLANAIVSYATYLGMTVWPAALGCLYTHPYLGGGTGLSAGTIGGAAVLLLAITGVALWQAQPRPWLLVGWLWYLGLLVPTIGLVQVGNQALADRYTYVPLVGIFLAAGWGLADLVARGPLPPARRRAILAGLAAIVLLACAVRSYYQVQTWQDSETLYTQALAVSPTDPTLHYNLGSVLLDRDAFEPAEKHFRQALDVNPDYAKAHNNLSVLYRLTNRPQLALQHAQRAAELTPDRANVRHSYGLALQAVGRDAEALDQFAAAATLRPDWAAPLHRQAVILTTSRQRDLRDVGRAIELAKRAAQLTQRRDAYVLQTLATAYAQAHDFANAALTAEAAWRVARARQQQQLASQLERQLERYRQAIPATTP